MDIVYFLVLVCISLISIFAIEANKDLRTYIKYLEEDKVKYIHTINKFVEAANRHLDLEDRMDNLENNVDNDLKSYERR